LQLNYSSDTLSDEVTDRDVLQQAQRRDAKDALFAAFAGVAKALGNGHRAEIVDVLAQGERAVEELAGEIDESVANTSQHLQRLAAAGIVRTRRDGNRVLYRLTSDDVAELWASLRRVAASHVAAIEVLADAYMGGDHDAIDRLSAVELAERVAAGRVVVLDVRPRAEYEAGHIAGACWASLDDLDGLAGELNGREVVAYCRGPYCVFADDAVRILQERGVPAARLDVGFPEWRLAGLPVTVPERASDTA